MRSINDGWWRLLTYCHCLKKQAEKKSLKQHTVFDNIIFNVLNYLTTLPFVCAPAPATGLR